MPRRPAPPRLAVERLEARDTPAALLSENFDALSPPTTAYDFSYWGNGGYVTSKVVAASGGVSLASTGDAASESRYFSTKPQPADAAVSASVYSDTPTPAVVLARGQNLTAPSGSYVGVRLSSGGTRVELVDFRAGVTTVLASVAVARPASGVWLGVTLKPAGTTLSASVRRADTGESLGVDGTWQATPTDALRAAVPAFAGNGSVGVGRGAGGAGLDFFDDFRVDAPQPPAPGVSENFDATPLGGRPAGWNNFASDGTAGFAASAPRPSGSPGYTATGGTNTVARSWPAAPQPADVQASASLYADSLVPGTLIVRGSNLDTARPTYYGLSVTRGVEARIVRVVGGVETTLGTVKSAAYVSGVWLRLTLTADGGALRAVVSRPDAGTYLTPDGTWSDAPQPALEVGDPTPIAAGVNVGLQRNAKAAGPVTFDDFAVGAVAFAAGPQVRVAPSQPGTTYSGDVTFTVTDPGGTARRAEFRVNGKLVATAAAFPAAYTLDTTTLANGPQALTVRAVDGQGNPNTVAVNFTTANAATPPPARPAIPRKLPNIRIAQLAYDGNPLGAFEQARLKDSVDLVVPNPKYLAAIDAASPGTPQVIYSNVSNLYQGLLTNWLSYADANRADREAAFYHVTQATPFTGSSPSSQPVTWFWGVTRGATDGSGIATDLTSAAHGGQARPAEFGGVGTSLSVGFPDKFAEFTITLARPAAAGWAGALEYATAVDGYGRAVAWKPLAATNDATAGFTRSGRVAFLPPTDWVTSRVGDGDKLFTVRVRTLSGTDAQAPAFTSLLGRDYVYANGTNAGTIPAFDAAADRDGDGYLSDAEFVHRAAGKDARFASESRLFYPYYGQMRFATNPSSSAVRNWAVAYHQQQLAANSLADGVFLDNSGGRLNLNGASVAEPTAAYSADYAALVAAVTRKLPGKVVLANTSGGNADATAVSAASTAVLEEFLLRPTEATWSSFNDVAALVKSRLAADSPSPYVVLDSHPGSFPVASDRVKVGTLAYYYLLADPDKTMLMLFGGFSPAAAWSDTWITAVGTNVGQAKGAFTTFAAGKDPQNAALDYKVYRRDYDNAVVLYKPRSYTLGQGTGTADDATGTTHDLGGRYRALHADGMLGPVVTSVTLRNGEGAVMMRA